MAQNKSPEQTSRRKRRQKARAKVESMDRAARELRRKQRQAQRSFTAALEQSRPNIGIERVLKNFENISQRETAGLVRIAMRSLAFASAANYAGEELNNQLGAEDITFQTNEIEGFARRLARVAILRKMLKVFRLPPAICEQIINLQISKDFGGAGKSGGVPIRLPLSSTAPPRPVSRGQLNGTQPPGENPFLNGPRFQRPENSTRKINRSPRKREE